MHAQNAALSDKNMPTYDRKDFSIMFNARKFLVILLSLALSASLTACEKSSPAPTGAAPTETVPTETAASQTPDISETAEPEQNVQIIKSAEAADVSGMTKTYSTAYDINSDGVEDNISLYINAQKDKNGILMLEDSHRWTLIVTDGILSYTLFDSVVSNGSLYAEISEYYKDNNALPTISLIKSSGTGLSIINYTYNKDAEGFEKTEVFTTDSLSPDGINKISSSIPEPEAVN